MSLTESTVEDAAPTWFGNWAMQSGTGRRWLWAERV